MRNCKRGCSLQIVGKMNKIVFLEKNSLGDDVDLSMFENLGEVTFYDLSTPEDTPGKIQDAEIVVANKVPMNAQTLKGAQHLKLIALTATGYNMVDKAYTDSQGISVANVRGYSTDSVAQHTFALALALLGQLAYYDTYVKSGAYVKSDIFCNLDRRIGELAGKTWGILGLGAIGRRVAEIARAFGCDVRYYSTTGNNNHGGFARVDLPELLAQSDIVSIHAPLNEKTENLINRDTLRQMKPTAILVNVARGPIVNERDLVDALKDGIIAGAGLDVLSAEPMRADSPLLEIQDSSRLIVTPHIAWATVEARRRLVGEVYENVAAFLRGEARNIIP